jgi:FAD/FMN-containing dehydrogenase
VSASPGSYPAGFTAALAAILGPAGLREGAAVRALDPGVHPGNLRADVLARPDNVAGVSQVLALASRFGVAVVAQGGRTGLAGGAVTRPGQLILSLERLNRIEDIAVAARTATVEAGVTLEALETALAPHGLSAGIDLGARGSATIGGLVSTNAGGIDAFRYGTMRERVLGLEAVLASGQVVGTLGRVRKDNAGLALRQLFIGAEGTLGIVTRVVLALVPARGSTRVALALTADLGAGVALLRTLEAAGVSVAAAELMSGNHFRLTAKALGITAALSAAPAPYAVLFATAAHEAAPDEDPLEAVLATELEQSALLDVLLPKNAAEERDLWRIREDWAVDRVHPGGLWFDVSVPLDALDGYLDSLTARLAAHDPALAVYVVGHLADGNVHVTVNAAEPITRRYAEIAPLVYADLRSLGGSFSAEHGIGTEKVAALEAWVGPEGIELMRRVKAAFDPAGILNPGKVLRLPGTGDRDVGSDPEGPGH